MDPHLSQEDVAQLIGRLVLEHELALRRQQTLFEARVRQLEGELRSLREQGQA